MGVTPHAQHPQATGEVVLHTGVATGVAVAAEDVVDQDVQAAMLGLDPGDQAGHGRGVLMVDDQGRALPAGGGHQLAGVLDRLRPPNLRPPGGAAAAAGGVDVQPGPGQLDRDRASRPPGRPRHQGDPRCLCSVSMRPESTGWSERQCVSRASLPAWRRLRLDVLGSYDGLGAGSLRVTMNSVRRRGCFVVGASFPTLNGCR